MNNEKYDDRGNLIYSKNSKGFEMWAEYDKNDNIIYYKNSEYGDRYWSKYDDKGNLVYMKDSNGREGWCKYDENDRRINITEEESKYIEYNIKIREHNLRIKCSRFELMEI